MGGGKEEEKGGEQKWGHRKTFVSENERMGGICRFPGDKERF